jgi:hypothetical protein
LALERKQDESAADVRAPQDDETHDEDEEEYETGAADFRAAKGREWGAVVELR